MSHEALSELIRNYGYLAVLVGTFLEGETVLILGGFAAHMGLLELPWVMAAALTGSFTGDQLYYYIGRRFGPKIIARRLSWQEGAEKVYRHLRRHQNLLILSFRFFYGLRNVTPFAVGAAHISRARFFILNLTGAVIWSVVFAAAGYLSGEAFRLLLEDFRHYELYVLLGLLAAGALFWLTTLIRRRRRAMERSKSAG
jgi:membrane protein DedA with SNARE-associated domain